MSCLTLPSNVHVTVDPRGTARFGVLNAKWSTSTLASPSKAVNGPGGLAMVTALPELSRLVRGTVNGTGFARPFVLVRSTRTSVGSGPHGSVTDGSGAT